MNPRLLVPFKLMSALALLAAIAAVGAHQVYPRVALGRLALLSTAAWGLVMALIAALALIKGRSGGRRRGGGQHSQFKRRWSD